MPGGRTKTRITVAIEPGLAKALDRQARGREITRSAAVEEALSWWLRTMANQDAEALDRLGNGRRMERSEAAEARIAAEMVLEALRHQFPAMGQVSDHELRRRALSKINGR